MLNGCAKFVQNRLYSTCLLCGAPIAGTPICAACQADLPTLPQARCPSCALPSHEHALCGHCLRSPPDFDHTEAVFAYGFPLTALVQQLKYRGALEISDFFAQVLAEQVRARPAVDLMIPMPSHPHRLRERGFNQAVEITRQLAHRLPAAWEGDICVRLRDSPPQAGLELKERRRNLRGIFSCPRRLDGLRIAMIDDVMTTGSSLNELAKTLRQAGAAHIEAWAVARTLPHSG